VFETRGVGVTVIVINSTRGLIIGVAVAVISCVVVAQAACNKPSTRMIDKRTTITILRGI
jgi:hypothetical protein